MGVVARVGMVRVRSRASLARSLGMVGIRVERLMDHEQDSVSVL